jgi:death-on-curing protein
VIPVRYLTVDEVRTLNEEFIGPDGLCDRGLLESSVMRPQQGLSSGDVYPDLHHKAAALFHSLAGTQAFLDGNKRTAVNATLVFYEWNGWELNVSDIDLYGLAVDVANGKLTVDEIAAWLEGSASELPS